MAAGILPAVFLKAQSICLKARKDARNKKEPGENSPKESRKFSLRRTGRRSAGQANLSRLAKQLFGQKFSRKKRKIVHPVNSRGEIRCGR